MACGSKLVVPAAEGDSVTVEFKCGLARGHATKRDSFEDEREHRAAGHIYIRGARPPFVAYTISWKPENIAWRD